MPFYTRKPSGDQLTAKLTRLVTDLKNEGAFITTDTFASHFLSGKKI
jgi:hypothetical protein